MLPIDGNFGYLLGSVYRNNSLLVRKSAHGEYVYAITSVDKKFKDHHISITPKTGYISEISGELWFAGTGSYLGDNLFMDMRKYLARYGVPHGRRKEKRDELYIRIGDREVYFTLGRFEHKNLLVSLHYLDHHLKSLAVEETFAELSVDS